MFDAPGEDGVLRSRLAFYPNPINQDGVLEDGWEKDGEFYVQRMRVKDGPVEPKVFQNVAGLVFARTRLRTRLGLPANDCGARKPNSACTCLTAAIDELGEGADKATILAEAKKRHKRPVRRWHRKTMRLPSNPQPRGAGGLFCGLTHLRRPPP